MLVTYLQEMSFDPCLLKQAILIYGQHEKCVATLHAIADSEGKPVIMPGRALERSDIENVLRDMEPATVPGPQIELMPENVLVAQPGTLAWWLPSARRRIYFRTGNKPFDAQLNGKPVLHPALVFLAKGPDLFVWAMAQSTRPTLKTQLWRAPYMNLYHTGHMCEGDYRFPDHHWPAGIANWEKGFFETHFSHTNIDQRLLTKHQHGHDGLWRYMAKSRLKNFPVHFLAPADSTTGKSKVLRLAEALTI